MTDRYGFTMESSNTVARRPLVLAINSKAETGVLKNNYTATFPQYKDVISIELIKAIVPNDNVPTDYMILKIANIGSLQSNDNTLRGVFCTLERAAGTAAAVSGAPIVYQRSNSDHNIPYIHYFDQPVRLNQLQIQLLKSDGTAATSELDNLLVFEINTLNQPKLPF